MSWQFLTKPRWLAGHVVIVVMVAVMIVLSHWQYSRLQDTKRSNAMTSAALHAQPITVTSSAQLHTLPANRRVALTGTLDAHNMVYLRYPVLDDLQGFELLVPLRLADGSSVIVNEGWIPQSIGLTQSRPTATLVPKVEVTGITQVEDRQSKSTLATKGVPAIPTVSAVDPQALDGLTQSRGLSATYVQLQAPVPAEPVKVLPLPVLSEGSHWSYTLQWAAFAILTVVGYVVLLRKAYVEDQKEAEAAAT